MTTHLLDAASDSPVPVKQLLRWQDDGGALLSSQDRQPSTPATTATAQLAP